MNKRFHRTMIKHQKIKFGKKHIRVLLMELPTKNLIVLAGSKGYLMCGYLNLAAAQKFKDAAVKITGVSTINQALRSRVHSYTSYAGKLGVYKGQPVREVLELIL